jgi:hypothetical protein
LLSDGLDAVNERVTCTTDSSFGWMSPGPFAKGFSDYTARRKLQKPGQKLREPDGHAVVELTKLYVTTDSIITYQQGNKRPHLHCSTVHYSQRRQATQFSVERFSLPFADNQISVSAATISVNKCVWLVGKQQTRQTRLGFDGNDYWKHYMILGDLFRSQLLPRWGTLCPLT